MCPYQYQHWSGRRKLSLTHPDEKRHHVLQPAAGECRRQHPPDPLPPLPGEHGEHVAEDPVGLAAPVEVDVPPVGEVVEVADEDPPGRGQVGHHEDGAAEDERAQVRALSGKGEKSQLHSCIIIIIIDDDDNITDDIDDNDVIISLVILMIMMM